MARDAATAQTVPSATEQARAVATLEFIVKGLRMSLSQKLLSEMATHGPTHTILNSVLKSLNRQKLDLRAYFEDPDSPAIVCSWAADPKVKAWITSAVDALVDS